jgi:hypothetical protein
MARETAVDPYGLSPPPTPQSQLVQLPSRPSHNAAVRSSTVTMSTLGVVEDDVKMDLGRRPLRMVALAVVVALPLLGSSGVASAKTRAPGCRKAHTCKSATAGPSAPMTIQVDPNPVVETSSSAVVVVIQIETSPSFAGDLVYVTSSQLAASCSEGIGFATIDQLFAFSSPPIWPSVTLDNEGNGTIDLFGQQCAPGPSLIEADMTEAPYYTATETLNIAPPTVTTPGVFGFPTSSGIVPGGEVETGDGFSNPNNPNPPLEAPDSAVYAVFYVEADPVYAEQPFEVDVAQLVDRCGSGYAFLYLPSGAVSVDSNYGGSTFQGTLDDDGNGVVTFIGDSCAAGSSVVTADVEAGTHPTYTTTFNILAPQPTI